MRVSAALVVLGLLLPLFGLTTGHATAQDGPRPALQPIRDRYVVVLEDDSFTSAESAAAAVDRRPGTDVDLVYDTVFVGLAGEFTPAAAAELMSDPSVAGVYPDLLATTQAQTLEPGIDRVDADYNPTKAGNGSGSVDVDVAVIDTGVGPHNDLNMVGGYDCLNSGSLRDNYGHGTHVAGIIGAMDNSFGVVGVAPGARIWSVKVLDQYGNGSLSSVICGMEWVAERGDTIEVANMSLGLIVQDVGSGCTSSLVHRAICAMTSAGVTVMAAACNAGIDASTCSPGRYPEVISVSAFAEWDGKPGGKGGCRSTPDGFYGCDDRRASFSNYGPTIDIAAIGVGVYSTLFDNRYGYWSGTSMATPHVTGAAALLIAQHGDMSPANVRERLLLSAMKGPVPGDPDAYPEPIVNVASLGKGTLDMPSSARPGEQIRIRVGEVLPRTKATFIFGGREIGTATVTVNGNAYLTYRLPDLPYGKYTVTVTNERKTLTDRILVRPSLVASDREVRVGDTVSLTLRGFGANESVLITYDTGAGVRSVARVRADASGKASGTVIVPPSTAGYHRVTAADGAGHSTVVTIRTLPSLAAPSLVEAGTWLPVKLRGFSGGENVDLRWGSATGPILRTKGVTASGSGDVNVLIPADSTNGKHSLWAVGSNGNGVRLTVSTFGQAVDPDPSPTPTLAEPTGTSEPTEAATQAPTETATGAPPTETSTLEPSATSTLESTAAPEPTWTPQLDVSPTGEPGLTTTALE